jgi:plastocyanin
LSKDISAVVILGITAAILAVPQAVFAVEVHVDIVPGATPLGDRAYAPNPAQANIGDTVVWTNRDSTIHTATSGTASDGPTELFGGTAEAPVIIAPSGTQQFIFEEPGDFPYYCVLHPTMVGVVQVTFVDSPPPSIESSVKVVVNGTEYAIFATSITSNMTGGALADNILTVSFDKAGSVTLEIPKAIFSNVTAITLNGEALNFETVTETDSTTTIELNVPEDNVSIVIVPEFPFVFIVLAMTFTTLISFLKLYQRKTVGD